MDAYAHVSMGATRGAIAKQAIEASLELADRMEVA